VKKRKKQRKIYVFTRCLLR